MPHAQSNLTPETLSLVHSVVSHKHLKAYFRQQPDAEPRTLNPEPGTLNPEPRTQNPEPLNLMRNT